MNGREDVMGARGHACALKANAAICILCSAVLLFRPHPTGPGCDHHELFELQLWVPQYSMAVNVGDTVVWVNE